MEGAGKGRGGNGIGGQGMGQEDRAGEGRERDKRAGQDSGAMRQRVQGRTVEQGCRGKDTEGRDFLPLSHHSDGKVGGS